MKALIFRRIIQVVFLAAFLGLFFALIPGQVESRFDTPPDISLPAWLLCLIDPLAAPAAFIASRGFSLLLLVPVAILAFCLVIPRFFCSHVCPVGTLCDTVGFVRGKRKDRRMPRLKVLKNVFLAALLACAVLAIPAAGFVTPMPILTRALGAVGSTGINWPWLVVLLLILSLSLLRRRFWCNYLCPSGALLSAVSRFSLFRRIRNDSCFQCGRCRPACTFDAIRDDFTTGADCTFCLSCGRACPARAIEFAIAGRRADAPLPPVDAGRRQFIIGTGAAGGLLLLGGGLSISATHDRFRPPGSLPGDEFRARCIRCGACAVSCPGSAIETIGFTGGLPDYGTPELTPWLCMPNCTRCGRVCPTAAIRSLTLDEKRRTSVGMARHIDTLCIPRREIGNCTICHDACRRTRRNAIYFEERVVSYPNPQDASAEVSVRFQIPMVDAARCIGCGACLRACERENVLQRGVLPGPAIRLEPYREQVLLDE